MNVRQGALKFYEAVERVVVVALLAMLAIVVLWGTWSLGAELVLRLVMRVLAGEVVDRTWSTGLLEQFNILRDVFGAFLLILIGLELMKTVIMYLEEHAFHIEVVLTVAVIAIARHAIEVDLAHLEPLTLLGMGAMLLALIAGLYIVRSVPTPTPTAAPNHGHAASSDTGKPSPS